ncbi:MAG: phage portal protein [Proteobacteria bacterium]|nr:MAG: phage portal protein [Pseudomonadota bacterium]
MKLNPFTWFKKSNELTLRDPELYKISGGYDSYTHKIITADTLLYASAMWSGIRLISETIGTLPLNLYKRTENGRIKDRDNPLFYRFATMPNKYESDIEWKEQIAMSMVIYGTGYSTKQMFGNRGIFEYIFNDNLELKTDEDEPYYIKYKKTGQKRLEFDEVIRVKGFGGLGSLEGSRLQKYSKHAVALALAADEYGGRFFGQGGRPSGVLQIDRILTPEQRKDLREAYEPLLNPSMERQGRLAITEAGMKYSQVSGKNNESQFIETRKYQTAEAARFLRIPLWMMMEPDGSKFNNNEQGNQHFLQFTLRPYLVRIEKALNTQVLSRAMQSTHYFEFDTAPLLRPDTQTRFDVYGKARTAAILTTNEIRAMENKPPIKGGDEIYAPLNSNSTTPTGEQNEN